MENNHNKDFKEIVSDRRKLAYVDDFKNFIKENSGFINYTHQILKDHAMYGDVAKHGNVVITRLPVSTIPAFKVEQGGQSFFIKISEAKSLRLGEKGFDEFITTQKSKELIGDLSWAEVLESQLGYKDEVYAYYVSKWSDLIADNPLDVYIESLELKIESNPVDSSAEKIELKDLRSKVKILRSRLQDYWEVTEHNMAYDTASEKIYIFDLHPFSAVKK